MSAVQEEAARRVHLVTDSTNYLSPELLAEYGVERVSLFVTDGQVSTAEVDLDHAEFFQRLKDMRTLPTSSQPSVDNLVAAFRKAADQGSSVLGIFLSSKMSGTVETAHLAADMVIAEGGSTVEILDTESNCMQEGFAVLAAARAAADGGSVDECVSAAQATMKRTRFLFSPTSLEYLRRGGRIGNAAALAGALLQLCPVLTVENGVTTTVSKVRTHEKALAAIAELFESDVAAFGLKDAIVHSIAMDSEAARFARERVEPLLGRSVPVVGIGPVIGLHVGPAVGLVYETREPRR